tara:strand:- start:43 stop:309 length:267 start_codon:yes stop_codon:yes gene_type:complete
MILYKKTNSRQEHNSLGFDFIYEDKYNFVFITYGGKTDTLKKRITNIYVEQKQSENPDDVDFILGECYEIVNYGSMEFKLNSNYLDKY